MQKNISEENKMSKFKAGDKVETPFGVGIFYGYIDGGFMSGSLRVDYEKVQTGAVYFWNEDDIKPYKTAHEKLIDLGWEFCEWSIKENFKQYEKFDGISRRTMSIRICKDRHGIYYFLNNFTYVEKELSKILTQYLVELEND